MTEMWTYLSSVERCNRTLMDFDDALHQVKSQGLESKQQTMAIVDRLLKIIEPITDNVNGRLSTSIDFNDHSVTNILYNMHKDDWISYRKKIRSIDSKLRDIKEQSSASRDIKIKLTPADYKILDDVANAMDRDCDLMFRRSNF